MAIGHPDTFGTAASELRYHVIVPGTPIFHDLGRDSQSLIEKLGSPFDALMSAATNSNYALEQLSAIITTQ